MKAKCDDSILHTLIMLSLTMADSDPVVSASNVLSTDRVTGCLDASKHIPNILACKVMR